MDVETKLVAVVIVDGLVWRFGALLDEDVALTLIAVASEDPSCWDEIVANWPRYRSPAVCEFASGLPITVVDQEVIAQFAVDNTSLLDGAWVAIDLVQKRILTGCDFMPVGRDQAFAMVVDESGDQQCPLSIHLPPWWELIEQTDASAIFQQRKSPPAVPNVNRKVLMGDAMINDLASRVLEIAQSERWSSSDVDDQRATYRFTLEVHRDWLMTPREDLDGRMPRQLLHGAHPWIDRLVSAQRIRFESGGQIVAAPDDVAGYDEAPMGLEEMVVYFDLCRELISAGWHWCSNDGLGRAALSDTDSGVLHRQLVEFLRNVKEEWLANPLEYESPPSFIVQCSRRRVPRGVGVEIVGMAERQSEEHIVDCNCPICIMMADGMFGPGFSSLDGHHLDLDDEFAFSTHETRQEWEEAQREFADLSVKIDRDIAEKRDTAEKRSIAEKNENGEPETDSFASVWLSPPTDGQIPGDPLGHMKLAFLAAEIVSMLEASAASTEDIKKLNLDFSDFRTCDAEHRVASGKRLNQHMESLAQRYPDLVSRIADFQSRIDEQTRSPDRLSI